MGIEPTGLGDIFMTPELSPDAAGRGTGTDFSSFLNVLAALAKPVVGEPTAPVGNPTPEGETAEAGPAPQLPAAMTEEPLPMFMKIAEQLAVAGKAGVMKQQAGAKGVPFEAGAELAAPQPAVLPGTQEGSAEPDATGEKGRTGQADGELTDDDGIGGVATMPLSQPQILPPTPPVNEVPPAEPTPSFLQDEAAVAATNARPQAGKSDVVPADGSGEDQKAGDPTDMDGPNAPAAAIGMRVKASTFDAAGKTRKNEGTPKVAQAQEAGEKSLPPLPDTAAAQAHLMRGTGKRPDGEKMDEATAATSLAADPGQTAQNPAVPGGMERHLLTTVSGQTPMVAGPAPTAIPQPAAHQQVMDDLMIGNAVEDEWIDRLAQDVQALVSSDNREARLHLRPRELGDLSIKLEMHDGQTKVHFTVDNAAAQSLIADASPRLQAILEDRGFRLSQSSVDVGGGSAGRGGGQGGQSDGQPLMAKAPPSAVTAATRAAARQTAFERYA